MPDGPPVSYKWKPIEDLPESLAGLEDLELEGLGRAWQKQREALTDTTALKDFNDRLAREWSIETGVIEGIYSLDRGTTQTLVERGISSSYIAHDATDKDPELVARIIRAHGEVLDGLFAFVKQERQLSTSYIKEVHAAMLRYQDKATVFDPLGNKFETDLIKGDYKRHTNSPSTRDGGVHEYCPPEHVASEMDRLIELHRKHLTANIPAVVEAVWLHHRFTQIHPFQDGNGRVARTLASLVLIRAGLFPLVVNRDVRDRYIDSLEKADSGDLSPLCHHVTANQKRTVSQVMGLIADLKPVTTAEDALRVAREHFIDLGRVLPPSLVATAEILAKKTSDRINGISLKFAGEWSLDGKYRSECQGLRVANFNPEGVQLAARKLEYIPNLTAYDIASGLILSTAKASSTIVVSIHGAHRGLGSGIVAVAYFMAERFTLLSEELFEIRQDETSEAATVRYQPWLEKCLIDGIVRWRRSES